MAYFSEQLESRTLFSGISTATVDYDTVIDDASTLSIELKSVVAAYKADAKVIVTDIKALPKSKTNSADISSLNKSVAAAAALDGKAMGKLISAGKASLSHAKGAFLADIAKSTAAHNLKLAVDLAALSVVLAPYETALNGDIGLGDAKVDAALSVLTAANPTDSTLATDVGTAETNQTSAMTTIDNELATIDTDIVTLVAAV